MLIKSGNCVSTGLRCFFGFRFWVSDCNLFPLATEGCPLQKGGDSSCPSLHLSLATQKNFVTDGGVKFRNEFSKLAHCNFCNTRLHGHEACGQEVCFCLKLLEFSWLFRGWNLWWLQGGGWWVVGLVGFWVGCVGTTAGALGPECDQYLAAMWSKGRTLVSPQHWFALR